jgi:SAM-dependent methyltransferase
MDVNEETRRYWNEEGGQAWVRHAARFDAQLVPFAEMVLAAAAPQPGERVLDIGCGNGALTREMARAVQPGGDVTGIDVSEPMVALARSQIDPAAPASFVSADAQTADLTGEGPFDLLVSRFGVMFFDDPVAAFANLRGSLGPEGRLAFVCWQDFLHNPWMLEPMAAALQHVPPPPLLEPGTPGPWAFGDPDRVRTILDRAGFHNVELRAVEREVTLGGWGDAEEVLEFLAATSLGRLVLLQDDAELQARVHDEVRQALQRFETPDGVRLGSAVWVVTAVS